MSATQKVRSGLTFAASQASEGGARRALLFMTPTEAKMTSSSQEPSLPATASPNVAPERATASLHRPKAAASVYDN
jgi:hypothetical protein